MKTARRINNRAESSNSYLGPSRVFVYALPFLPLLKRGVPFWPGLAPLLRYYRKWIALHIKNQLI
ncbi:MAG: hypothetical protein ABW094_20075 [Candidatus Thiodiazotropha sp.]